MFYVRIESYAMISISLNTPEYFSLFQKPSNHNVSPSIGPSSSSSSRGSSLGRCKVLYDYDASLSDELSLRQGDVIAVLKKSVDGWWYGETLEAGTLRRGLFPATYVQEADA